MNQDNIEMIRKEVVRLTNEQIQGIFEPLLETPDFFKIQDQQRNLSCELIKQWTENIKEEVYKAERLEATFVVVGTMKAGKSTTINAIVGTELLPNRNQPMTVFPTIIRHCAGKKEPELTFPNPEPLNKLIESLREKLEEMQSIGGLEEKAFCSTTVGKELIQTILKGSLMEISTHYKGADGIYQFLTCINDIWRLCSTDEIAINMDDYLRQYNNIQDLPAIEVEFFHLREQDAEGKFALIDMPGHNEAGQTVMKNIVTEQMEKASAVIVILDYTQLNAEAEDELRKSLAEITNVKRNQMFVLVNKYDQKDRNGMNLETLRAYVSTQLFEGRLDTGRIFPVSSKYAYLANRALHELLVNKKMPDHSVNPWIEDFGQLAFGTDWTSDIDDAAEVKTRAEKLWQKSHFDQPLVKVIKSGLENAATVSLKSSTAKMAEYDSQIIEHIQFRINALNTDTKVIEGHIELLEEDIGKLKSARVNLTNSLDKTIIILQEDIGKIIEKSDGILKKEIQLAFNNNQGEALLVNRIKRYTRESVNEVEFDSEGYIDFATQEAAREFLNQLVEAVLSSLQQMQQELKIHIDDVLGQITQKTTRRLEKLLKTAEQRLNESFSVSIYFPKPKMNAAINVDKIAYSSISKETVTKTNTQYKRKWYTFWTQKHRFTYKYQEKVFRIYTIDVLNQLQSLLKEDSSVWRSLDRYVQSEIGKSINIYVEEVFGFLERLKGDLLDSKHDQTMESENIERLKIAMDESLKTAISHREQVQALEKTQGC